MEKNIESVTIYYHLDKFGPGKHFFIRQDCLRLIRIKKNTKYRKQRVF